MIRLDVHEAEAHLSQYVDVIEPVEEVLRGPRPIGIGNELYGPCEIDPAFHEPLPDTLLDTFGGW